MEQDQWMSPEDEQLAEVCGQMIAIIPADIF